MISYNIGRIYPIALTIAGSDSGGGAGIQADLKTFAALQVHGVVALTSITAQNTYEVTMIHDIPLDMIEEQIRVVYEDLGVDAAKSGMLHTADVIKRVAGVLDRFEFPYVLDPVMIAKSGAKLLRDDAIEALIKYLFPRATVVTPNKFEAERIAGFKISSLDDAKKAAVEILSLGPKYVVVKGGHLNGYDESIDIFYDGRDFKLLRSPRYDVRTTHGTGCSFSAAITAFLARGFDVYESVRNAKKFMEYSIKYGLEVGKGSGPVNPMAYVFNEASRYHVLEELYSFANNLAKLRWIGKIIPEVGLNIAYSTPYPLDENDVAAFPGRIRYFDKLLYSYPRFGASRHLARYILSLRDLGCDVRAAMNIKYSDELVEVFRKRNFRIGMYDRSMEPREIKEREGYSVKWGVKQAYGTLGVCPEIIYHRGDWGKEPMIVLTSNTLSGLTEYLKTLEEIFK